MQGSKVLGDEAAALYERAITGLMKHSMLLYFAYADFEEVTKTVCDSTDTKKPSLRKCDNSCLSVNILNHLCATVTGEILFGTKSSPIYIEFFVNFMC